MFDLNALLKALSAWVTAILVFFGLPLLAGCANPEESPAQREARTDAQMAWVDKLVTIAERHGVAYRIEVDTTGRPSIGESLDLYFDSGLRARGIIFGNAAGAPGTAPPSSSP